MKDTIFTYIDGKKYEVLDTMEHITLADSFVKNKTGNGHGEAKLYVGNKNSRLMQFFDDLDRDCFFLFKDFERYLLDADDEFNDPMQDYSTVYSMPRKYVMLKDRLATFNTECLYFKVYWKDVAPPRMYIQSDSEYYDFMRDVGLPDMSYLSIMKLKDRTGKIIYYFRIFFEYGEGFQKIKEKKAYIRIQAQKYPIYTTKQAIIMARNGQGIYRRKLLEECPFCPISLIDDPRILIASHIKPWVISSDMEKLDPKNGLLLCPNYDALFDKGLITFNGIKQLIVSPWISPANQERLRIYSGMEVDLLPLDEKREEYMEYHRTRIYKG